MRREPRERNRTEPRWWTGTANAIRAAASSPLRLFRTISLMLAKDRFVRAETAAALAFPDGLTVILLGTGCPLPDARRVRTSIAVVAGKHSFIIDAVNGADRNLQLARLHGVRMDAILLTHFHSDHIASLGDMMLNHWATTSANEPLVVIGPPGVETVVKGFNEAYSLDNHYRTAHHGVVTMPPTGAGGVARTIDIGPESDASAAVSANPSTVKIAADIPSYHSSPEDAARMAASAGAGMLVLSHIIPPLVNAALRHLFVGSARTFYRRPIIIGRDGMMFILPAHSKEVRREWRFR